MNLQRAAALVPGELIQVQLAGGGALKARSVVIATGARWREINVPGEREYRNRGVAYCPHCDGPLFKGKRVAVIGGGNSGVEAAIDLAGLVSHVTLIEFDAQLRADAVLIAKLRSLANVARHHGRADHRGGRRRREGDWAGLQGSRQRRCDHVPLAGVFVQIGLVPNTDWLKGTVKLSPRGEIEVDARGADLRARRIRGRRLHRRALQADRHCGGRRRQGVVERVRSFDPLSFAGPPRAPGCLGLQAA